MQVLLESGLSDKTKGELPSAQRVDVTFRNINWMLHYWKCVPPAPAAAAQGGSGWDYSRCYPDPICAEFGFKYVSSRKASKQGARKRAKVSDAVAAGEDTGDQQQAASNQASQCSLQRVQWLDEE